MSPRALARAEEELNELARNVPYAHHTKSSVENDQLMLPNGRVYGRDRLLELEKKNLRMNPSLRGADERSGETKRVVVDPVTGDQYRWDALKKVYIT